MPVPIGYGLYVLGNIVVRAIIKTQGKKLIAAGARKVSENAAKQIAKKRTGGVIKNATSGNVAGLIRNARTVKTRGGKVSDPKPTGSRTVKTREGKVSEPKPTKSRTVKTRKGKVTDPKPTKSRTVKTREGKVSDPKPTKSRTVKTRSGKVTDPKPMSSRTVKTRKGKVTDPKPTKSRTVKTRSGKVSDPKPMSSRTVKTRGGKKAPVKPTKTGSKTSKTSTSKGKQSNLPLIVGLGSGVAGAIMALGDKKPYAITEGSRTVKTREGKGSTVDKSKSSPKPKLRPKDLKKPAAGPVSDESFGAAFKRNRKANKATFTFKDKLYTTRIKEESIAEHKKKFGVKGKYK